MPFRQDRGKDLLAAILGLSACLTTGCSTDLSGEPPHRPEAKVSSSRLVRIAHPALVQGNDALPSSLYVERDVRVTARRSGVIEKVLVDRGAAVASGQTLAVLESDVATAELDMARQDSLLAKLDFNRIEPLFQQKIASLSDYDRAKIALSRAQSRVALAEAGLERCFVRAPFPGQIAERWALAGLRVEEDDGTPLFRIVAKDALRARVDIPEGNLHRLKVGGRAWLEVDEEASAPRAARIAFIGPAIDPASGTAPVIVEALDRGAALKLGASVKVRFEQAAEVHEALIRLPREAVSGGPASEGLVEIRIVQDGHVAKRRIQLVDSRGSFVLVRGPISPSDQVILGEGEGLADGDPVSPTEDRY
jgi:membrane fusion protein (multidrug efflux system)